MSILSITYPAKCKDCIFLEQKYFGKMKRHICTNQKSPRYDPNPYFSRVALRDPVCSEWRLVAEKQEPQAEKISCSGCQGGGCPVCMGYGYLTN